MDTAKTEGVDPLYDGHQGFDWETVERALGEIEDGLDDEAQRQKLRVALAEILRFICGVRLRPGADAWIGRRCIALCWVVNPELFGGVSLTKLAESIGHHKMALSPKAADATRKFNVRNRFQAHGWQHNQQRQSARSTNPLPEDAETDEENKPDQHGAEGEDDG